jgi:hypothetical protein
MFYSTATYHSVFHYDEVHRRSSKPSSSSARPSEGRQPKSRISYASDSFQKSTCEDSDPSGVPATSGTNESRHEKEASFQLVIREKAAVHHDADDEEPMIAEDALFARITGPKRASMVKSVSLDNELHTFDDVVDDVK